MQIAVLIVVIVNLGVLALLGRRMLVLDSKQRALRIELAQLGPAEAMPAPLDKAFLAGRKRMLTVEILNPLELATLYNRLAGVAGAVAPNAVRAVVYEQAAKITRDQLAKQSVEADVQVHVAD